MTRINTVLLLAVILALAACAPTTPDAPAPTLAPTVEAAPTQETVATAEEIPEDGLNLGEPADGLFTAEISGDVTATVAGSGSYTCPVDVNLLDSDSGGENRIEFVLPAGVTAGEYTVGTGENTISSSLLLENVVYDDDVFGILTLETVPEAAGETVSGSFDMNYTNATNAVNASGTFNLTAVSVCE